MLPNSYVIEGNMGWEDARLPGAPLDGYWYFEREGYQGCFEQFPVYEIADGQFYQHFEGYRQALPIKAKSDGETYVEMRMQPGLVSKYYFKDRGQELHLYRREAISAGQAKSSVKSEALLKTCDNPSLNGALLSFYYRVFDPLKPKKNITRKAGI